MRSLAPVVLLLALVGSGASWAGPGSGRGPRTGGPAAGAGIPKGVTPGQQGTHGPGRRPNVMKGRAMLNSGMSRSAIVSFREAVERDPANGEAHIGLGQALARTGRCREALPHLTEWTHALAFGPRAAVTTAVCLERTGEVEAAVEMDLWALARRPDLSSALTRLALDADRVGDPVLRDVAMEHLWYAKADRDESLFAEAALALRHGDLDLVEFVALVWAREGRDAEELDRLRARAALDSDDPTAALAILAEHPRLRRGTATRLLNLEASRREGLWVQALAGMQGRIFGPLTGGEADAIRARVLVDAGDLAGATEALAAYADELDEELVASRWYLARAGGDEAAMARHAEDYARVCGSPTRRLELLIPLDRR